MAGPGDAARGGRRFVDGHARGPLGPCRRARRPHASAARRRVGAQGPFALGGARGIQFRVERPRHHRPRGLAHDAQRTQTFELGYGMLPFWRPEIEFERETVDGRGKWSSITFENTFQLTQSGKYFADLGLFAAYSQSLLADEPSGVTGRPDPAQVARPVRPRHAPHAQPVPGSRDRPRQPRRDRLRRRLAIGLARQPALRTGVRGLQPDRRSRSCRPLQRAISFARPGDRRRRGTGRFGALRYEIGYQFGLSSGAPRGAVRWKLEYLRSRSDALNSSRSALYWTGMTSSFAPRLDVLPEPQQRLWYKLGGIPAEFALYGGTAIALHLGHRQSVDFDFFGTGRSIRPLTDSLSIMATATSTQVALQHPERHPGSRRSGAGVFRSACRTSRARHRRTSRRTTDCGSPPCSTLPARKRPCCSRAEAKD